MTGSFHWVCFLPFWVKPFYFWNQRKLNFVVTEKPSQQSPQFLNKQNELNEKGIRKHSLEGRKPLHLPLNLKNFLQAFVMRANPLVTKQSVEESSVIYSVVKGIVSFQRKVIKVSSPQKAIPKLKFTFQTLCTHDGNGNVFRSFKLTRIYFDQKFTHFA